MIYIYFFKCFNDFNNNITYYYVNLLLFWSNIINLIFTLTHMFLNDVNRKRSGLRINQMR